MVKATTAAATITVSVESQEPSQTFELPSVVLGYGLILACDRGSAAMTLTRSHAVVLLASWGG